MWIKKIKSIKKNTLKIGCSPFSPSMCVCHSCPNTNFICKFIRLITHEMFAFDLRLNYTMNNMCIFNIVYLFLIRLDSVIPDDICDIRYLLRYQTLNLPNQYQISPKAYACNILIKRKEHCMNASLHPVLWVWLWLVGVL